MSYETRICDYSAVDSFGWSECLGALFFHLIPDETMLRRDGSFLALHH